MASFVDAEKRTWNFKINYASASRVREKVGVDLLSVGEELFAKLGDPIKLIDTLWILCEPEAKETGITEDQFVTRFDGDTVEAAVSGLIQGLCDFFPSRSRGLLLKLKTKIDSVQEKAAEKVGEILDSDAIERALGLTEEKLTEEKPTETPPNPSTESSGKPPDTSESTPVPTP